MCFVNVRSLVNNFNKFKLFVLQQNFDIVGISETWLTNSVNSEVIQIDGYTFVRQDRGARGGGVGVYLGTNIRYEVLESSTQDYVEQIWLKIYNKNGTFVVGNIYRPPGTNLERFLNHFEDGVANYIPLCTELVCGGDFNINLLSLEDRKTVRFLEAIDSLGMKQIVNEPTRLTENSMTLIDLIMIAGDNKVLYDSGTKDTNGVSDHLAVFCTFNYKTECEGSRTVTCRNLKNIDADLFNDLLQLTPFENILYINDVHLKVCALNSLLLGLFDTIAPIRSFKSKRCSPPWLTQNIREMIRLKNKALKRHKRLNSEQSWSYYKQLKNQVNGAIQREKAAFVNFCVSKSFNMKLLWSRLRSLDVVSGPSQTVIPHEYSNPTEINNYFLSVSKAEKADRDLLNFYTSHCYTNFSRKFKFNLVQEDTISKILNNIKSNATGPDNINIHMILMCCPFIMPYIVNIINSCLLDSVFPRAWKVSKVLPQPKKSKIAGFSDLRPISILPTLSKVLEKIMAQQISEHLKEFSILPEKQSGFRPGYSCTTAMLDLIDDILRDNDSGSTTALVLLDYSKAFDTLNHELLLTILKYVGFSESAISLLQSFITDRYQYVSLGQHESGMASVTTGVPQGSVLGPLLFCVYTCCISRCLNSCKSYFYADDTQLRFSFLSTNRREACDLINSDLTSLALHSKRHNLRINPDKSNVIIFGKNRNVVEKDMDIFIDNKKLPITHSARSLGLEIDSDLRFTGHVNKCVKKSYLCLKMLYPHRHTLSRDLKKLLTNVLVLSNFDFCDSVYGPCLTKVDANRIQRVQRSCLRFIYGIKKYEHVSFKLQEAGWLSMEQRRHLHACYLFHSIITTKTPPYLYNKITFRTDVHNLGIRFRSLVYPPPRRTSAFSRSFTYNIYSTYNKVPSELWSAELPRFKRLYKNRILHSLEGGYSE